MAPSLFRLAAFAAPILAQFPPTPVDVTTITSELNPDVTISYKELPGSFCETTEGTRSFSGYVNLPQSVLSNLTVDFDIHTYFIYFEARHDKNNAPLLIYFAGGPSESSTYVAFSGEGSPCYVNPDGNSTTLSEWSLNNHANVLYIDQPVGAGFSYTSLVNATYNLIENSITVSEQDSEDVPENPIIGQGTYGDPAIEKTTNTTIKTAKALWHFAEHWLTQFPEYTSNNKKIGIWGNSHAGLWVPATAARILREIESSADDSPIREWSIDNIGLTNAATDFAHDLPYWPEFLYNNTYTPLIEEEIWAEAQQNFTKDDGCLAAVQNCRRVAEELDPDGEGTVEEVNAACRAATAFCLMYVGGGNMQATELLGRSAFDIAVPATEDGDEACHFNLPVVRYLNQDWTHAALGVPLNFTYISESVMEAYTLADRAIEIDIGTGDAARVSSDDLDFVLQNDIKVALVYGDRDPRCPWIAAESLPSSDFLSHPSADTWNDAGYELIRMDNGEVISDEAGGAVKQVGGLSFSRVFQAGHIVNAYSPQTVHTIVVRTFNGTDIATGTRQADGDGFISNGTRWSQELYNEDMPTIEQGTCMVDGSFQDESVWDEVREAAASMEEESGDESAEQSENAESESAEDSGASAVQIGASFIVPMVITIGLSCEFIL